MTHKQTEQITVPSILINVLIETVAHWDITAEALLKGTAIDQSRLQDPFSQIDYQTAILLTLRAIELTGEPALPFYAGLQMRSSSYGQMGFTMMVARDLRAVIEIVQQFVRLLSNAMVLRLEIVDDLAVIYVEEAWLDRTIWLDRTFYEFGVANKLAVIPAIVELLTGKLLPFHFDIEGEKTEFFHRFEHLVKATMSFGQPYTRVVIDASYLDTPCIMFDPILAKVMEENCAKELKELIGNRSVTHQIRSLIQSDVVAFDSLDQVAEKLHLSTRSLQRKLQEENQSFRVIYHDVFVKKALQLLKDRDVSLDNIAEQLGYSTVSSFMRAFKRLTGETPRQYSHEA